MRNLLILLFIISCRVGFAQNQNDQITGIRKVVAQINSDSGYTIKKLDGEAFLDDVPDNGAELTGYFKNGTLVKMIEWIGLSSCINITEYYLQNDQLVFTYTRGNEAPFSDSLQTIDTTKMKKTLECRFYYDKGKMIKMIANGSTRCGGPPSKEWAKNYFDECIRYEKLLITK